MALGTWRNDAGRVRLTASHSETATTAKHGTTRRFADLNIESVLAPGEVVNKPYSDILECGDRLGLRLSYGGGSRYGSSNCALEHNSHWIEKIDEIMPFVLDEGAPT